MIDADFFGQTAQRRVEFLTLGLGLLAGMVVLVLRGWPEGAGLALGACVAWINFRWLRRLVGWVARSSMAQAGEGEEKPRLPKSMVWQMFGRYTLLGLVLYVMLLRFYWPALAFLCGLFALIAAVLLELIGELVFWGRRSMLT
ncbi:MAG TPA: ATP synthase subunit I [Patescibacteria group bacterium]|nr:ATP synthase subunit I [Patescibacteria group bacterium]